MRISTWGMSYIARKTTIVLWAEHMKLHVNNVSLYFSFWSCKCKNWLIASFSLLKDCNHWIMNYSKKNSRSRSIKSYCQASLRCVLIYLLLFQVVFKSSLNWNNKLQKVHGWQASFYFVDKDLSLPPEGYLHRTNRVKNQEMLTKI